MSAVQVDDVEAMGDTCRFCGLELDALQSNGEQWHKSCAAKTDSRSDLKPLPSHPMYGRYGVPVGYQG